MIILILVLVLIIVPASTWWFGLWNNLINLVNFLLSALIAMSTYELLGEQIASVDRKSYGHIADFTGIWLSFALSFIVLRGITDSISKYKLKFDIITERAGCSALSFMLGLGMMCFTSFSLQLAPLPPSMFGDADVDFNNDAAGSLVDEVWLNYVRYSSTGPLAAGKESNFAFKSYTLDSKVQMSGIESRSYDPANVFYHVAHKRRRDMDKKKQRDAKK